MKVTLTQVVEKEESKFTIEDIGIGDKRHNLCINQFYNSTLELLFDCKKEGDYKYKMRINERGISFLREAIRGSHYDVETLLIKTGDNPGPKKGTIEWLASSPSGWETYYVEFGAIKVDY